MWIALMVVQQPTHPAWVLTFVFPFTFRRWLRLECCTYMTRRRTSNKLKLMQQSPCKPFWALDIICMCTLFRSCDLTSGLHHTMLYMIRCLICGSQLVRCFLLNSFKFVVNKSFTLKSWFCKVFNSRCSSKLSRLECFNAFHSCGVMWIKDVCE